jgi:DNA-binding beta-propeller fold protein YncE
VLRTSILIASLLVLAAGTPVAQVPSGAPPETTRAGGADSARAAAPASALVAADSLPFRLRAVSLLVSQGDGRGQAIEPSGVAVDPFGRVVVSDAALHRLQRFEPDGRWLGEAGSLGSDPGQLRRPGSVAMLGTLSIVTLDQENRRIERYDLFGRRLGTLVDLLDPALETQVGRVDPVAIASDRGGALYLADAARDRVLAFDFSGRYQRTIGGYGARPGSFRGLGGLATSPRGGLLTAERVNRRLQQLDTGGRVVRAWPLASAAAPGALPVAVDDSSRVAVADESGGRVWVFDESGRLLASLAGLARPRALAFASDGTLLVAEAAGGVVRRFAIERSAAAPGH